MDLTTHCNLTRMIWGFLSLGGQRSVDLWHVFFFCFMGDMTWFLGFQQIITFRGHLIRFAMVDLQAGYHPWLKRFRLNRSVGDHSMNGVTWLTLSKRFLGATCGKLHDSLIVSLCHDQNMMIFSYVFHLTPVTGLNKPMNYPIILEVATIYKAYVSGLCQGIIWNNIPTKYGLILYATIMYSTSISGSWNSHWTLENHHKLSR